ncbi:MAG: glycoside hydrolase family 2 TIM barrel-domain containing protein [bacterium]
MRAYPHFNKRKTHDLNGIWDFTFMDNGGLDDVIPKAIHYNDRLPVPSAFDALPAYAGKRGLGIYRCFVEVTPHVETVLKIGGAGMTGRVYVDGVLLAEHSGTYTPFEVRIPAAVNVRREIVVATDNRYDFVRCPLHENYHDFYNYGGLIRQVWLEELPVNAIRRVQVVTEDLTTGQIRVKVEFYGAPAPVTASIDGGAVKAASGEEFTVLVPEPTLWSVEAPTLHRLTVDSGSDSITVRFGLRQVTAAKGQVLLNGKPVKLLGYCRHEAHPQFGPATPETLMAADLQLLREMGCNFVRGSHYQQDPRFLDLCDELGFLVFSESTGWGADHKQLTDPTFIRHQLEQTRVMVETDFNHPSVILWGFLNEGASDAEFARECYTRLIALIRALDPSRLVTYASNRYLKDIFLDQVDVVSFNFYPGWYSPDRETDRPLGEVLPRIRGDIEGLAKLGLSGKPFIISEIGAAALYGCRDPHQGFWTEDYQAELLRLVCQESVDNPRIAGLALWQFCDIRTYQGSGALLRPRGFNNKGTFDEYRRPKAACAVVKSVFGKQA